MKKNKIKVFYPSASDSHVFYSFLFFFFWILFGCISLGPEWTASSPVGEDRQKQTEQRWAHRLENLTPSRADVP